MTTYTAIWILLILQANGVIIPWYAWVLCALHPALKILVDKKKEDK